MTADGTETDEPNGHGRFSRRRTLSAVGGGAISLSMGLAGCVQDADDGDDADDTGDDTDDADDTDDDIGTVTMGVLVPESGPSAPLGEAQRAGAELGVAYVNASDEFEFEIDAIYEDTQTDPPTGREMAQKVVEEDGAEYVVGGLESAVGLAISEYVSGEDAIYNSGAATVELSGEGCDANTFVYETNAAQHVAGLAEFAAAELGTNWWLHSTDEAYGNSAFEEIERRIDAEDLDVEIVGETMPDFGTSDFGPQISQISGSDADVLVIPETGEDLMNFMGQADSAGLTDEIEIIGTALFAQVSRGALGDVLVGTYSSTLYDHTLDTGDNEAFVDAYLEEFDEPPGNFARVGYELVRTTARGIQEAGTSDPSTVRSVLEGLEVETVLGDVSYRECDHQAVNPVWTGEIVPGEEIPEVELLERIDGEDAIRPCEESDCTL